MLNHKPHWVGVVMIALLVLLFTAYILPVRPKARAPRIQGVNHVARVSFAVPSTNTPPIVTTNK